MGECKVLEFKIREKVEEPPKEEDKEYDVETVILDNIKKKEKLKEVRRKENTTTKRNYNLR